MGIRTDIPFVSLQRWRILPVEQNSERAPEARALVHCIATSPCPARGGSFEGRILSVRHSPGFSQNTTYKAVIKYFDAVYNWRLRI